MYEPYQKILEALHEEKWMSPKQLTRLLYPTEYHRNWRKAYDRIIKNLQTLRQKELLRYKDYGLGKDNLWALQPNPLLKDFGFIPPKSEIHAFKYEHEKACADVYVTLKLTGKLTGWKQSAKLTAAIIPDRIAETPEPIYLEIEMGSKYEIPQQAQNYRQYHFDTKKHFKVWFLVKEQWQYDQALEDLRDFPPAYSVELLDVFHQRFSDTHSDTYSDTVSG
jgi:hypothetical protein